MKEIKSYTIEYYENNNGHREKKIEAFAHFQTARDAAIFLLKKRCQHACMFTELHDINKQGLVCHRLRAWSGHARYQVTIKYHPSERNGMTYNPW